MLGKYLANCRPILLAAFMMSALCMVLFLIRLDVSGVNRFMFMPENLALAWLPVGISYLLLKRLQGRPWLSLGNIVLTVLWLLTLPNAWYVLTDFVHLRPTGEVSQYFDIVLLTSLVIAGFTLGFTSLFDVHKEVIKRLGHTKSLWAIATVILISSFAIYLGRNLRWNSWDVLANPAEILFDVSDRIVDPLSHPKAINMTGLFFALLSTIYAGIWIVARPKTAK